MTLFRADRALWVPSSSPIHNAGATRCPEQKDDGGRNDKIPKTARSQTRLTKKSTKGNPPLYKVENRNIKTDNNEIGDRDEFFQVTLTSNAVRCMADCAVATIPVDNDGVITNEDGEGIVLSNRPTVAGPFIIRLYNLQQRQIELHGKDDSDRDSDDEKHTNKNLIMFATSITDGTKTCLGNILQAKEGQLENLSECIVSVSGFVMGISSSYESDATVSCVASARNDSGSNTIGDENEENTPKKASNFSKRVTKHSPHIFITRYELLYEKRSDVQTDNDKDFTSDKWQPSVKYDEKLSISKEFHFQKCTHQNRGRLASLISSNMLAMDDFIRDNQGTIADQQNHYHHRETIARAGKIVEDSLEVSNFIEQHSAIMALKRRKENASLLSSSSFSLMLGSLKYFQNYTSAIKEFDQMQREDQFTSLSDMTEEFCADDFVIGEETSGRNSTCHDEQSLMQNAETLEYALQCKDEALSSELLLRWHAWLLGDGLEQEAGSFRSENVPKRVEKFCGILENHWLPKIREEPTNPIKIASFAAAAMLGFLDLVPFQVGNQRLARILLNWTIRRAGLPFCITLYSNREEKLAYISAIQLTRQNLCLVPQGYVDKFETTVILRSTGGLVPLVGYILNRLARATADLCMLVEKKACMASEETDARLVRLAREKAAEGTCIICFEDKPNIATLCCGKPIHLNCLAQWLKTNSSCPQCRSDLPSLSVGQQSHRQIDNRWDENGRESRLSMGGSNIDEFLFHSSSSSSSDDSPSSSSSSSSASSAFFYSGLDYDVNDIQSVTDNDESTRSIRSLLPTRSVTPPPFENRSRLNYDTSIRSLLPTRSVTPTLFGNRPRLNYVTSDEEVQLDNDSDSDDASRTDNSYQSETDEDIDRYSFHTNDSQRSYTSNFELSRNDDIDIVSDTQSTGYNGTTGDRYDLLNEYSSADSENSSYRDNEISSRETSTRTSTTSMDFLPFRMPFLDPELLGSVQNVQNGSWSNGENSRGNDGDILEVPEFIRPQSLRDTDDVYPSNSDSVTDSCDFPSRREPFTFSRRSRWS